MALDLNVWNLKHVLGRAADARAVLELAGPLIEAVERQSQRLRELVDDVVDVRRGREARHDLALEDVDLAAVAAAAVARVTREVPGVELAIRADEAVGRWDRSRIEAVVAK